MEKDENEKPARDERTLKLLKKYFYFFKQRGYLPKKWINHILDHMDQFFAYRDEIAEEVAAKDASMDALSIDQILAVIETLADQWADFSTSMDEILENQDTARGNLQKSFDDWYDSLNQILKDIEDGDWYNPVDFVVYCDTDQTLIFYYGKVPDVGETYNGRLVTAVYSNFSNNVYSSQSDIPWERYCDVITDVIFSSTYATMSPVSVAYWFYGFSALEYLDLTYLDTRAVTSANDFAVLCPALLQITLGDNTDIFSRFFTLVSQEYWYTKTILASANYMYGVSSAGTYYSYSPTYSGEIRAIVPSGYTDDIIFVLDDTEYVLTADNNYSIIYNVPMYDGAALIDYSDPSVTVSSGYTYEIDGSVSSGYDISVIGNYLEVPITVTFSEDVEEYPDTVTVTLTDTTTAKSYTVIVSAADDWTGSLSVPETVSADEYYIIAETLSDMKSAISGDLYNGYIVLYESTLYDYKIIYIQVPKELPFFQQACFCTKLSGMSSDVEYQLYVGIVVVDRDGNRYIFYGITEMGTVIFYDDDTIDIAYISGWSKFEIDAGYRFLTESYSAMYPVLVVKDDNDVIGNYALYGSTEFDDYRLHYNTEEELYESYIMEEVSPYFNYQATFSNIKDYIKF